MKIYYHSDYAAAAHVFATTRKSAWVYGDLMDRPLSGIEWAEPFAVTPELLKEVHAPDYVEAVRTGTPLSLASSSGFPWDPGIWRATTRSTGGAVTAAVEAWRSKQNTGSLSSGLHHARRARGTGYCTFNGLALAAHTLLVAGAKRVLILDLDAHGGGGTHEILDANPSVVHVDIATCSYDRHAATAPSSYDLIRDPADYLPLVQSRLDAVLATGPFDLCLFNAGVDCHENDPAGGLVGITAGLLRRREEVVFAWGQANRIPISFVLAGGYPGAGHSEETVVALHRQTIEAALGSMKSALN